MTKRGLPVAENDDDIVLELRDLYVGYYKDLNILQALNIKARKNQITAILGANGVGKSTAVSYTHLPLPTKA